MGKLLDADIKILQGTRNADDSCSFSTRMILNPGDSPKRGRELAFDPDTCRSLIEVGTPDPLDPPPSPPRKHETSPVKAPQQVSAASFSGYSSAWARSWFTDPCPFPCIEVNEVEVYLGWYWYTDSVNHIYGDKWQDFENASGWVLWDYLWWTGEYENYAFSEQIVASYKNPAFCFTINTWTRHEPTVISGYPNGIGASDFDWSKSGGCNWLLSYNWDHGWFQQ